MTTSTLQGKKVAILVTDGFEQVELLEPRKALDEAGAKTQVVSPAGKKVKGWNHKEWGNEVPGRYLPRLGESGRIRRVAITLAES